MEPNLPPGTPVVVCLADGRSVIDHTASDAMQWGSVALVTLAGRPGMWMTAMLEPVRGLANAAVGLMVEGSAGQTRPHPLLATEAEYRRSLLACARALRLLPPHAR